MLPISSDWIIASPRVAPSAPARPAQAAFPLEGCDDIYEALPDLGEQRPEAGPLHPTLSMRLLPGLDAMQQTVRALGKHPAAEAIDRSNLRRLIRALVPVVEAHRESFPRKRGERALEALQDAASAMGRYKDAAVIAGTVKRLFPGGVVPPKMEKKLRAEEESRQADFHEAWRRLRKHDLEDIVETLGHPRPAEARSPRAIEREDRRLMANAVDRALDGMGRDGLVDPSSPREFHGSRKALRHVLTSIQACGDTLPVAEADMKALADLVDCLGRANDLHITQKWLEKKGYDREAREAHRSYEATVAESVTKARTLEESALLPRLRATTRAWG